MMSLPTDSSELETDITDITITPDGRIRCFGLSRQLLALLCETGMADEELQKRWNVINNNEKCQNENNQSQNNQSPNF